MSPQAITPVSRFHEPASRAPSCRNRSGRSPPGLKSGAALEAKRDAAEVLVELFGGNPAPPGGGVVEMEMAAVESVEDDEVAELPEQDQGQPQLLQLIGAHAEPAAFEAVVSRGAQDARGAAAVPAHLAFFAQFGERHPSPEVGQYDAETGGAAFRRVHLQQNRRGHLLFSIGPKRSPSPAPLGVRVGIL